MSLGVLIALVVGGIAGIAVLTHLFGLSERGRLASEEAARNAWAREFPRTPAGAVTLARDGRAALVATGMGPGLVWSFGADTTARFLSGARVTRTATGLDIRLSDITAPRVRLRLEADEAEAWAQSLEERAA